MRPTAAVLLLAAAACCAGSTDDTFLTPEHVPAATPDYEADDDEAPQMSPEEAPADDSSLASPVEATLPPRQAGTFSPTVHHDRTVVTPESVLLLLQQSGVREGGLLPGAEGLGALIGAPQTLSDGGAVVVLLAFAGSVSDVTDAVRAAVAATFSELLQVSLARVSVVVAPGSVTLRVTVAGPRVPSAAPLQPPSAVPSRGPSRVPSIGDVDDAPTEVQPPAEDSPDTAGPTQRQPQPPQSQPPTLTEFTAAWCSSDRDCAAFGDAGAGCVNNRCNCSELYRLADAAVPVCVSANDSSSYEVAVEQTFTEGDFAALVGEHRSSLANATASVLGAALVTSIRAGSIVHTSAHAVSVQDLVEKGPRLVGLLREQYQADRHQSLVKVTGPLSQVTLSVGAAACAEQDPDPHGKTFMPLAQGRCSPLTCVEGYAPAFTDGPLARCAEKTSPLTSGGGGGLSGAAVIGTVGGVVGAVLIGAAIVFSRSRSLKKMARQAGLPASPAGDVMMSELGGASPHTRDEKVV
eukprot:TRINITY_DN20705_c0_g1_i1.p1 TRINITY_DN20705_c0_g1~~TRINITY_DN20705_c0_g1_i1.p1  ORF type:complete len:521 (+),score=185.50 TRINITY_DN20705_c0_g1_i1:74-1636(+)